MLGRPTTPILLTLFLATVATTYAAFVFDPTAETFPARAFNTIADSNDRGDRQELIVSVGQMSSQGPDSLDRKPAPLEKISGEAKVLSDGTLEILGTKIRLEGLVLATKADAALDALRDLIGSGDVHCALMTTEANEIRDGSCWIMSGGHPIDIAAELMLAGLARECVKDTRGRYHAFEQQSAMDISVPPECGGDVAVASSPPAAQAE
jgi:hypothetical protein